MNFFFVGSKRGHPSLTWSERSMSEKLFWPDTWLISCTWPLNFSACCSEKHLRWSPCQGDAQYFKQPVNDSIEIRRCVWWPCYRLNRTLLPINHTVSVFCYGGKFMTPASMTELIQSRQQNKSRLVLSINFMVCPALTSHEILLEALLSVPSYAAVLTGFCKSYQYMIGI